MKNKKLVIILIIVAVVIIISYIIYRAIKNKNVDKYKLTDKDVTVPQTAPIQAVDTDTFPLKRGSDGPNVKRLQVMLNVTVYQSLPEYLKLKEDGKYGAKTEEAVDAMMKGVTGHKMGTVTWSEFLALKKISAKAVLAARLYNSFD